MGKKNVLHDAAGKKILHPADAIRKQAKKKRHEKLKGFRDKNFQQRLLEKAPEEIEQEIRELKADHERKRAHKIEVSKFQLDRLKKLEVMYVKLKDEVVERHQKRENEPKSSLYVDFEELKIHRKASVFYHPVMNPYGAPPTGQTVMYRHPDGSVKREPPPVGSDVPMGSSAKGTAAADGGESDDSDSDDDAEGGEDEDSEDDGADPLLPESMPGMPAPAPAPQAEAASLPPLPPGPPPVAGAPSMLSTMPLGPAPGMMGLPPLPLGAPPLPMGYPPVGTPPLPLGMSPLPFGQPPLPPGPAPGAPAATSQAEFFAQMSAAGIQVPGPPPRPQQVSSAASSSSGPKAAVGRTATSSDAKSSAVSKDNAVSDLPAGAKAPPPPPKKPAVKPPPTQSRASTFFVPTALRSKKPSQVAGGVLQASSASLVLDNRKKTVASEVPRVADPVNVDDAFADFMKEIG